MNNLLNKTVGNLDELEGSLNEPEEENNQTNGEPEVGYWAFGSTWQDTRPEDVDEMAEERPEEFETWLAECLKPDLELAEASLAYMVVKNDPNNGNYTIALWTDGHIDVESNDDDKRSLEHAAQIVATEEVSDFLARAVEIVGRAVETAAVVIDRYSEQAREAGVNVQMLGELTADPKGLTDRLKQVITSPQEHLK